MRLAILTAALLAGCTTIVPWHEASNTLVCENFLLPDHAPGAHAEANRRGLDCGPYLAQRQAQREAQSRALNNAAQYFNRPAPPRPRPIHCTSQRIGNNVETTCF